jgi:hypothetical protein
LSEDFLYDSPENAYAHVRMGNIQKHWRAGVQRSLQQAVDGVNNKEVDNEQQTTK